MEEVSRAELEEHFTRTDLHSVRSKAIIQLKSWEENMFILIERTYATRLNEIDSMILNRNEIEELNSSITIRETIPEDFHRLIEQTIHIQEDDDDDFVIINDEKDHPRDARRKLISTTTSSTSLSDRESRASKIFHSEPVQHVLTVGLTQALSHAGTMAATSTPAIATAAVAKTFLFGTVCVMGKVAMDTTNRVWSLWN